ncbi:phosphatase 2C 42 [Fagus crenata]
MAAAASAPDHLFNLRNNFFLGAYQAAINHSEVPNLSPDDVVERDCLVYRSYIALGSYQLVIHEIDASAATPLQAVKLLALFLSAPEAKESTISRLKEWLADPAIGSNAILRLIAGIIFMHDQDYNEALKHTNSGGTMELLGPLYIGKLDFRYCRRGFVKLIFLLRVLVLAGWFFKGHVPFQVPLEVNVVLIGFNGDGGYRYMLDAHKLEEFLRVSFPTHRPSWLETGKPLDIEHNIVFSAFPAGQAELIELEKALKGAMVPAVVAREADFGRELPLFEVEATVVEPVFHSLYSYIFDVDNARNSAGEMDKPVPNAIFIVNFDKVRMDPRNKEIDLDSFMYGKITQLTEEDMKKQEGVYIYRYRYNGGGASQVWLGSGRFAVIDLSAGPCTYGKIETEEGSVSSKTLPQLRHVMFPSGLGPASGHSTSGIFIGQLASLISTAVEHVIAPDVRFEIVDQTTRLLIPIIVLQNHNRYNILEKVKKMVHDGQEVVIVGGSHLLHRHEKLSIAVSKAMRGHSLQETKNDGRFHVHTKTFLDGAILKEEMERSADVLAAGLLEVADPSLSSKFYLCQVTKPVWASYDSKRGQKKKKTETKQGDLIRTYGTRVIPVFVLSLADVDAHLMMEDGSLVWTSNDVVIVLEHQNEKIPLSYVSETERRHVVPSQAQRHILAGLASVVGGLSAPYEKASHVHERPVVNWLWATGCHPFGPFSNTSLISQMLQDVALRNTIYARVDSALHRIRDTSEAVESFACYQS